MFHPGFSSSCRAVILSAVETINVVTGSLENPRSLGLGENSRKFACERGFIFNLVASIKPAFCATFVGESWENHNQPHIHYRDKRIIMISPAVRLQTEHHSAMKCENGSRIEKMNGLFCPSGPTNARVRYFCAMDFALILFSSDVFKGGVHSCWNRNGCEANGMRGQSINPYSPATGLMRSIDKRTCLPAASRTKLSRPCSFIQNGPACGGCNGGQKPSVGSKRWIEAFYTAGMFLERSVIP